MRREKEGERKERRGGREEGEERERRGGRDIQVRICVMLYTVEPV